jgi:endonuclease-3
MEDIVKLPEDELIEIIRPCGLYKSKGKSIRQFAELYCNEWNGKVPSDVNELMKCPGVGKKIANLIVGEVYGIPAVVVDTHCKRVMYRTGISDNTDPLKVEGDIKKVFPEDTWISLGHKAVDLGRTYCDSRSPKCGECPLTDICRKRIKK